MRHDAYHKTDGLPSLHGSPPSLQKLCPDLGRITAQNLSQLGTQSLIAILEKRIVFNTLLRADDPADN